MSSPPPSPDNRFLALRAAAQDASDFRMADDDVRRFIDLRDAGAGAEAIAAALGVDTGVASELVRADEAQALAHRIAAGEEPWYPAPPPGEQVVDERLGSSVIPVAALIALLLATAVYLLLR